MSGNKALLRQVQQQLDIHEAPSGLVDSASRLLSSLTHLAGVVMVPKHNQVKVRQIEFVPLSGVRVLTVIVNSTVSSSASGRTAAPEERMSSNWNGTTSAS